MSPEAKEGPFPVHPGVRTPLPVTKSGFDPDEPRDERGRWTGPGAGPTAFKTPIPLKDLSPKIKPDIPPVPKFPPGESIYRNIEFARTHSLKRLFLRWLPKYGWWDYNTRFSPDYDAAGNFNFGATAAAYGLDDEEILRCGAAAHMLEGQPNKLNESNPLGTYPYGNTREKEGEILAGIQWYRNGGYEAGIRRHARP